MKVPSHACGRAPSETGSGFKYLYGQAIVATARWGATTPGRIEPRIDFDLTGSIWHGGCALEDLTKTEDAEGLGQARYAIPLLLIVIIAMTAPAAIALITMFDVNLASTVGGSSWPLGAADSSISLTPARFWLQLCSHSLSAGHPASMTSKRLGP